MAMLSSISNDIDNGRVIWGMLRANEYLSQDDPLHKALRFKAMGEQKRKKLCPDSRRIFYAVVKGSVLAELSVADKKLIDRSVTRKMAPVKKVNIDKLVATLRQRHQSRLRSRVRLSTSAHGYLNSRADS